MRGRREVPAIEDAFGEIQRAGRRSIGEQVAPCLTHQSQRTRWGAWRMREPRNSSPAHGYSTMLASASEGRAPGRRAHTMGWRVTAHVNALGC